MTVLLDLFPSLGDVAAAVTIAGTFYVILLEARRQEAERYDELERQAPAPRDDAADGHFRIR